MWVGFPKGKTLEEVYGVEKAEIIKEKLRISHLGHKPPKSAFKKGHLPWNTGKHIQINTGRTHFKKGCKHIFSPERNYKISEKLKERYKDKTKHPSWRGGVTPINTKIRFSSEYQNWRINIFIRDEFTCQECREKYIYMQVHHIKPFSKYPNLRFDINNGITLCRSCHKKYHKQFGRK